MTIQELRIGNLILTPKDKGGKPFLRSIVEEIKADSVIVDGQRQVMIEDCAGIALTEEWLKGFGYESLNANAYYQIEIEDFELHINWKNGECFINFMNDTILLRRDIKDVHQLQNLWFSLIGSELTITQPA